MVQFGLAADPTESAEWRKKPIQDEQGATKTNSVGRITFAKTGAPNSRTTQLFINYGDNANLDGMQFAPFGKVRGDGMKVMDNVYPIQEKPNQMEVKAKGNKYMDKNFPEASKIISVRILPKESKDTEGKQSKDSSDKEL